MLSTTGKSIEEWERLERVKLNLSARLDCCLRNMNSESSEERIRALHGLKTMLRAMTEEERGVFAVFHTSRHCDAQKQMFEMMKKKKSPKSEEQNTDELLSVLDIVQGLSLLHYDSKKIAGRKQNLNVILTYLASRDQNLVIAVLETLETILIDSSENLQAFERICGLQLIGSVLKRMRACESITHKCIELFTIYLQHEGGYPDFTIDRLLSSKRLLLIEYMGREFVEKLEKMVGIE
ncbi:60S ribosomal protein L3 [Kappamyces sp. JEL0829]|nr:60S ribosomal protein L3 [Kappamyces sp. JEL0829]